MTVIRLIAADWNQLRDDARRAGGHGAASDGARLRRKLWRKELGMAIVALGAAAMFLDAAMRLSVPAV